MKILTLGGFSEVGKNMSALVSGDEAVIFDMGLFMPKIVGYEEEITKFGREEMIAAGAIPDDTIMHDFKNEVKAIVLTHAHLDHIGAVPYLAKKYDCPVYGTPYTIEILKRIAKDKGFKLKNKLYTLRVNDKIKLSDNLTVEFINVTHSTLQCVIIAVHTSEGTVVYANDFKLDDEPVLGDKPNYKRLKELKNVRCLIVNSLYSCQEGKTPSESVAREKLREALFTLDSKGKGIIVTSFASHVARLKSVYDFGRELNRKVIFFGRSMHKYLDAAVKLGLVSFPNAEIVGFSSKVRRRLKRISKEKRDKYLIACTGNQAEPGSVLDRMINGLYKFKSEDNVIFSSNVIPVSPNVENREKMEEKLKRQKVNIYTDVHVSGHASSQDLERFIKLVRPEHIIPAHAGWDKAHCLAEIANKIGYKNVHHMEDGKILEL
jgi:ribonuclease J